MKELIARVGIELLGQLKKKGFYNRLLLHKTGFVQKTLPVGGSSVCGEDGQASLQHIQHHAIRIQTKQSFCFSFDF